MKILTFLMADIVVVPLSPIIRTLYFWFMLFITVIYNSYLMSINSKDYL